MKYTLCDKEKCSICEHNYSENEILFSSANEESLEEWQKAISNFKDYLQKFKVETFSKILFLIKSIGENIGDESCKNCLFEFSKQVIAYLHNFKFLVFNAEGVISTNPLGNAAFASSIPPEHSLKIFQEIQEAKNHLVVGTDLHLLYLIIPSFKNLREPNWDMFI